MEQKSKVFIANSQTYKAVSVLLKYAEARSVSYKKRQYADYKKKLDRSMTDILII